MKRSKRQRDAMTTEYRRRWRSASVLRAFRHGEIAKGRAIERAWTRRDGAIAVVAYIVAVLITVNVA